MKAAKNIEFKKSLQDDVFLCLLDDFLLCGVAGGETALL
jgi:hypothetical protein